MSIRNVRQTGDDILRKKSKDVLEMTDKIRELIVDMKDTMVDDGGCGLAAVQVGVLRNIIIVQESQDKEILTLINPKIVEQSSETEKNVEGCLSVEGKKGIVERPKRIKVEALDENMNKVDIEAKDFFARILCHEIDHLNGVLYSDKLDGRLYDNDELIDGYESEEN